MPLPYKYPAISIRVVAESGAHISEIIYDAVALSQEMKMKVAVETARGILNVSPMNTTDDILEQWHDLGSEG